MLLTCPRFKTRNPKYGAMSGRIGNIPDAMEEETEGSEILHSDLKGGARRPATKEVAGGCFFCSLREREREVGDGTEPNGSATLASPFLKETRSTGSTGEAIGTTAESRKSRIGSKEGRTCARRRMVAFEVRFWALDRRLRDYGTTHST